MTAQSILKATVYNKKQIKVKGKGPTNKTRNTYLTENEYLYTCSYRQQEKTLTFNGKVGKKQEMQIHRTEKSKKNEAFIKIFNNKVCCQERQM